MPSAPLLTGSPTRRLCAVVAAAVCAGSACAPMTVHSYLERSIDLRSYHTYAWRAADPSPTGDPRLDNNRFFAERVRGSAERELNRYGFEKAASAEPDLWLHYHASVSQEIDMRTVDAEHPCVDRDCGPVVFEKGTLIVDLVDARTKTLVWRGWAESRFDGVVDDQKWMESRIDETVGRILSRLPARSAGS
jgi:hypothetical protein